MVTIVRTNSANKDFISLVRLLDADLATRDGAEHSFYSKFNKIDAIRHVVVAYRDNEPVGCGALKQLDAEGMEVKRMFVLPSHRGKAIASLMLEALESWAREMKFSKCILETGRRQPEAIALYEKNGYKVIPNYGHYAGIENSICFAKILS
jgi:GNAT superfamily N-acetyltransferase